MQANKIEAGKTYEITVGKNTTQVKVMNVDRRVNGQLAFDCMNVNTNKRLTVTDAKRFLKEVKPVNPPDRTHEATKKRIDELGMGPGSVADREDAERRDSIAKALIEAGAEPAHVEAAKVAMTVQAADPTAGMSRAQVAVEAAKICKAMNKGKGGKRKGSLSGLDAAAQVLAEATEPLNVKQITERAVELGWAPEGKTPSATLAAALIREIAQKGEASRFAKVDKGLFARK